MYLLDNIVKDIRTCINKSTNLQNIVGLITIGTSLPIYNIEHNILFFIHNIHMIVIC